MDVPDKSMKKKEIEMNDLIQNPLNDIKILDENGTNDNNKKNKRSRRRNKPSTEDVKIAVGKQLRCWNVFGYGGLGLFLLIMEIMWLRTKNRVYLSLYKFSALKNIN